MKSDNMTRVSLREAYDNKDVVAQIYAIRDTAESAVDTSEQAVTTANTASDHVDELVPQVETAVENANSASASAQASAQTVAGYENRLATVESDLNAVTLRVTTAEGDIVTIQGRVTALETADGQNVKLTGEHAIGNYAVLLTGNQRVRGIKGFDATVKQYGSTPNLYFFETETEEQFWGAVGVRFRSSATTNVALQSYAPKVNPSDPTEIRRGGFIQIVSDKSGTVEVVAFATNSEGTLIRKSLAYFNGTTWN